MKRRINALPGHHRHRDPKIVWDPAWSPQRISPEGRAQLGITDEDEDE